MVLGIPTHTLENIYSQNRYSVDRCLTHMIGEWLKSSHHCTWRKVIITMSLRIGGDHPAYAHRVAVAMDYESW